MKIAHIDGLHCADCALKIEKGLSEMPELDLVHLDFVAGKLHFQPADSIEYREVLDKAAELISQIEPGVTLSSQSENELQRPRVVNELFLRVLGAGLLFILSFVLGGIPHVSLVLTLAAFGIAGYDILWKALKGLGSGRFLDEFFLMSLASLAAIFIGETAEAAGVMIFYQIGEYLQDRAVNRSRRSIQSLVSLRPDLVRVLRKGQWIQLAPEEVFPGETIGLKPGERLALDGFIINGKGTVDSSSLTGESLPQEVKEGDPLMSGIVARDSFLEIRVEKTYQEGALARILKITQEATRKKAPTEQFIARFARIYTPLVVGAAFLTALIPPLFLGWESFDTWLYRALIFLVVSCPCALVVSIPLSYSAGLGAAARRGVLIKGSPFIDRLASMKSLVFDKTGTLTQGKFEISQIRDITNMGREKLISLAAQAEQVSNHPLAKLICAEAGVENPTGVKGSFEEVPGEGVIWTGPEFVLICGKADFLRQRGVEPELCDETSIHIARDKQYLGWISFSDKTRKEAFSLLNSAAEQGITDFAILSGDNPSAVAKTADSLGIKDYQGNLLPQDKLEYLQKKMNKPRNGTLAFLGDGINDAPVLALADIGISMGLGGSDSAVESSDVVLMEDNLNALLEGKRIALRTRRILWQNILFALFAKILFLTTGLLGFVGMWEALFADVGVALIAVLNSMRILGGSRRK